MSDSARRKEKQRLKRKQKQQAIRKAKNAGFGRIFSAAAERGLPLECYANVEWQEGGMLSLLCVRQMPSGRYAMAGFVIDLWCIGLKDAWGNPDISHEQFYDDVLARADDELGMEPIDQQQAQRLVAGAIRFSMKNGFRLPHRYERWTALIGGIGDIAAADLSPFAVDGKLRYVGRTQDLQSRLITGSVDDFFARPDVEVIADEGDLEFEDSDENNLTFDEEDSDEPDRFKETARVMQQIRERAISTIHRWLIATGEEPHPQLESAFPLYLSSLLATTISQAADSEISLDDQVDKLLSTLPRKEADPLREALDQIYDYAMQYPTPRVAFNALCGDLISDS